MNFSNNLRYLRKQRGISQDALADKLGYKSFTTIQKWESGVSEPSVSTLKIIANIFGVSMDQMINEDLSDLSQPSSSMQLTEQEATLLLAFRKLNGDGKTKVIEYTKDLSKIEKYQDSSPIKESLEYPSFGAAPHLAAEASSEYSSDLEAQLRKDADEIVRKEYKNAAKAKNLAK